MNFLWYVGAFAVVIGTLVTVHELGHFVVARLCGVHVLRFSFGFGPILWSRQRTPDSTEWALSGVPLGGYVKMLDEREGPVPEALLSKTFNRQHVTKRIAILLAGPFANFLLAIVIYWVVMMAGSSEMMPVLGAPAAGSPAQVAGIQSGDLVIAVGDTPTRGWSEFHWQMIRRIAQREPFVITVKDTQGRTHDCRLDPAKVKFDPDKLDPMIELGLTLPKPYPVLIGQVTHGGPADRAGVLPGDRIVSLDGQAISGWEALVKTIGAAVGRDVVLGVVRDGRAALQLVVRPQAVSDQGRMVGRIGIGTQTLVQYPPLPALGRAFAQTWESAVLSVKMLGRMIIGQVSVKNLSGPLTIADYAGQSAQLGLESFVKVLAAISVGIGVLNLLPIPLLDGGHIMYYLAEMLTRRPVPPRIMELGQHVGFALLAMLMAFALFNDITRQLS